MCNVSSRSVLTIGIPFKTPDDDIGKDHGLEDVLEKVLDNDLYPVGTEGPPCKYQSGEIVNINGVARVGADVIGTIYPAKDVGSSMVV